MKCAEFRSNPGDERIVTMCTVATLCEKPVQYFGSSTNIVCKGGVLRNILSFVALALSVYCAI